MGYLDYIAVYRQTDLVKDEEVEGWCAAANRFLREDVWPAWGIELARPHPPNVLYHGPGLTTAEGAKEPPGIVVIKEKPEMDGVGGFHFHLGKIPVARSYILGSSLPDRTFLHEIGEMAINPYLDVWYSGPRGFLYAAEGMDPTQTQDYQINVPVLGQYRTVMAPNFVYPAYFKPGTFGPYDHLGRIGAPYSIPDGGYQIAKDEQDRMLMLAPGGAPFGAEKLDRMSRTNQLMRGIVVPRPA